MKIVITGHTAGIGLAIAKYFLLEGHEVLGFSRSNGYNISNPINRKQIVESCNDADIFVNNVYTPDGSQFSLLKKVHALWLKKDKTIINISSRFTNGADLYCVHKKTMDDFCAANVYTNPYILNLKPGLTDTQRVQNVNNEKMNTTDIVKIIDWALKHPLKIHSITFAI